MKKLTILVDMDDVLENLVECWVDELNKKCGSSLCEEDITDWRIAKFFPSLTNEDLFSPLNTAEFWGKIAPKSSGCLKCILT
jgi:5'(3')-deoxyribonucleotidase